MAIHVHITEKAEANINSIADGIEEVSHSADYALDFINEIYDTINTLSLFPNSGCIPNNRSLLAEGYRFLIHKQYLIFYKTVDDTVYVDAVINSKQDYYRFYKF